MTSFGDFDGPRGMWSADAFLQQREEANHWLNETRGQSDWFNPNSELGQKHAQDREARLELIADELNVRTGTVEIGPLQALETIEEEQIGPMPAYQPLWDGVTYSTRFPATSRPPAMDPQNALFMATVDEFANSQLDSAPEAMVVGGAIIAASVSSGILAVEAAPAVEAVLMESQAQLLTRAPFLNGPVSNVLQKQASTPFGSTVGPAAPLMQYLDERTRIHERPPEAPIGGRSPRRGSSR
ncbi:MAG TPA: hypothetical protein VEB66_05225 [Opitutaceae bacterium]|nr:hypothetical protein [Opitutaceae bacterium]